MARADAATKLGLNLDFIALIPERNLPFRQGGGSGLPHFDFENGAALGGGWRTIDRKGGIPLDEGL
jgi:hypothetical protein